ncbi:MAG TPA: hypothetical protein VIL13_10935 [Longimicrobiales bacterium]
MSLKDWFRRSNHIGTSGDAVASPPGNIRFRANGWGLRHGAPEAVVPSTAPDVLPGPETTYALGPANGGEPVEVENLAQYLQRSAEEEEIDARLALIQRHETEIQGELAAVRERREAAARLQVQVDQLPRRAKELEEEIHWVERDLEAATKAQADLRHVGLLSQVVLYCTAALSFVLADIVMTREIVADALELTGSRMLGLDEGWYLAIGLAFVAVLLKPAYERLVEAPYWEGSRRWFDVTIIVTAAFALGTLAVLGVFRSIAYEATTLGELAREAPNADPDMAWQFYRELKERVAGNLWGKAAFVASGVLFALAGAICLGIGLRHFQDFRSVRRPMRRRLKELRQRLRRLRNERAQNLAEEARARAELRATEVWLESRATVDELKAQLASVRAEQSDLLARRAEVRQARLGLLRASRRDGEERRETPSPVPVVPPRPRRKRPRPYVAIRRMIRSRLSGILPDTMSSV